MSPPADFSASAVPPRWIDQKWWKLSIKSWVSLLLVLRAVLAILEAVFFRRRLVEYRPEHLFGVRDPAFFGSAHALADPLPVAGNKGCYTTSCG